MVSRTLITNDLDSRNTTNYALNHLISCLQRLEPAQDTLRRRPQLNISIPSYSPLRSSSPKNSYLVPYHPREIQPTTPKLSPQELVPQSYMIEPIQVRHLEVTSCPLIFYWKHPSFKEKPELILDISYLESANDQPEEGDSAGEKMFSLYDQEDNLSQKDEFYVKYTSSQHAFAQKGTEQLYNVLFESTGQIPVPENYLCFDLKNLDLGITGIASRINPHLITLEDFCESWQRLRDNYDETANKMLEALEPLHRILGNHDVHQDNVMIEINPDTQEPIRPQILDLGDTFIMWEKGIPVEKARSPQLTSTLYGPFIHLEHRNFTERELKPLEKFVSYNSNPSSSQLADSRILSIVDRYFSGSENIRNQIAHTIQARINSTYELSGMQENDEYLMTQRSIPERYNLVFDNHVFRK